jgi:predicted LPLAT superfamily acyltransferase
MAPTQAPRWWGRTRGGKFGNRFFFALARHRATAALAGFFLFWVALYFLIVTPHARRVSFALARRTGQGASAWRRLLFARRHFRMYATLLFERLLILQGDMHGFRFERHGEDALTHALDRGAVILTAHLGNWEIMGQMLSRTERPVTFVMYDGVQPELKATLEAMQQGRAFEVLHTDGSPGAAAAMLAALGEKRLVGMMGDRALGGKSAAVPFLGATLRIPLGPFALAAAAHAPVLYAFAFREGSRHYSLHAIRAAEPHEASPEKRSVALERRAADYARCLEAFVLAYPTQWGNFFPFWENEETPTPPTDTGPA